MAAPKQPVFVLVHGGWHKPLHYQPFVDDLEKRGYKALVPALPSATEQPPNDTPDSDTAFVADIARRLADEGNEVVLMGHSCGALAAAEAAHGLGVRERTAKGIPGGVRTLVIVAGMARAAGQRSKWGLEKREKPLGTVENGLFVLNPEVNLGHLFYSDVPKSEWDGLLAELTKHPVACVMHEMKNPAWDEVENVYVYCEQDAGMSLALQHSLVDELRSNGFQWKTVSIDAGHFPFLSKPAVLADMILDAV